MGFGHQETSTDSAGNMVIAVSRHALTFRQSCLVDMARLLELSLLGEKVKGVQKIQTCSTIGHGPESH